MEFMTIFDEGEALVWGLRVVSTEERIAKVTELPAIGEHYPNEHNARSSREQFTQQGDPQLDITKQGCKRLSLPPPYLELATHIIRYLTCEGRFSNLHAHHFKLLSYIRHNMQVNIPNFLYNMLCISAEETQKGKPNYVSHHALIKILVEQSLRDSSPISWAEFVESKTLQPQVNPEFVESKTLQPQVNPAPQNLENEEETIEPIQNLVEKEKEPSPNKSATPNLEDDMPSSSTNKGKRKVSEESPNLEKEAKTCSVKEQKERGSFLQ